MQKKYDGDYHRTSSPQWSISVSEGDDSGGDEAIRVSRRVEIDVDDIDVDRYHFRRNELPRPLRCVISFLRRCLYGPLRD